MNRQLHIILMILLSVYSVHKTHAQDIHFSQYFNAPLLVNPANTGFNPDFDYRLGANYRNQWAGVGVPYKTTNVWSDARLFNKTMENGWVGLGVSILNDVAGTGNLTSTQANLSLAYHQLLGDESLLSLGLGGGYVQKKVDISKLTFDNQWNGNFFDISINSSEPLTNAMVHYWDVQAGLNYAWFASDNTYLNAGFSGLHLNRPNESFYVSSNTDNRLKPRYNFFFNGNFKIEDVWILNPNFYISNVGNTWETLVGLNARRKLNESDNQFIIGLYYRYSDAAIPLVGFQKGNVEFDFSYDATVSALSRYNHTFGAYELSITTKGIFTNGGKPLKCPKSVGF